MPPSVCLHRLCDLMSLLRFDLDTEHRLLSCPSSEPRDSRVLAFSSNFLLLSFFPYFFFFFSFFDRSNFSHLDFSLPIYLVRSGIQSCSRWKKHRDSRILSVFRWRVLSRDHRYIYEIIKLTEQQTIIPIIVG